MKAVPSAPPKKTGGLSMAKPLVKPSTTPAPANGGSAAANAAWPVVGKTGISGNPNPFTKVTKDLSPLESEDGMAGFLLANQNYRLATIDQLFMPSEGKALTMNVSDLVAIVKECGLTSVEGVRVVSRMTEDIQSGNNGSDRALLLLQVMLESIGRNMEPFVFPLLPKLLLLHSDRSNTARELVEKICAKLATLLNPNVFRLLWPVLTSAMVEEDWRIKVAALQMLKAVSKGMSRQLSPLLPDIIPTVSVCIADAKKQVQTTAIDALNEACLAITNDDIRHLTPALVSVIARPEESGK